MITTSMISQINKLFSCVFRGGKVTSLHTVYRRLFTILDSYYYYCCYYSTINWKIYFHLVSPKPTKYLSAP